MLLLLAMQTQPILHNLDLESQQSLEAIITQLAHHLAPRLLPTAARRLEQVTPTRIALHLDPPVTPPSVKAVCRPPALQPLAQAMEALSVAVQLPHLLVSAGQWAPAAEHLAPLLLVHREHQVSCNKLAEVLL